MSQREKIEESIEDIERFIKASKYMQSIRKYKNYPIVFELCTIEGITIDDHLSRLGSKTCITLEGHVDLIDLISPVDLVRVDSL